IKIQENKKICFDTEIIKQSIKDIGKELETLNKQLNSLHDLVEQGVYSTDTFIKRSQNIESKINTAKASKDELETKLKNIFSVEEKKKSIIPRWEKVLNIYNKLESAKDKNELLKEILDKVIYTKEEGGRWSGKVDDFELVINPKLPQDH
ncbi:MAG TPA: recombinase family protein, partial [Thermoanaerobacterales bacterium]|nr:recombinase family protein [Thermoanaerobacterales bacterium]